MTNKPYKLIVPLEEDLRKFLYEQKATQLIPMGEIVKRLIKRYKMELERQKKI